jgi:16S rRNA (uracil1498-N3)-methyltransferase
MTVDARTIDLPEDEARHLVRALRLGPGDEIHVLNGTGLLRHARVATATKSHVSLELGAAVTAATESRVRLTLAQALLKGDKMDDVVRDAAMAGAVAVQPVMTAHTEPSVIRGAERRVGRWHTIAIGAAKQSGRAVVPKIASPLSLADALAMPTDERVVFVEPSSASRSEAIGARRDRPERATVFVGPEGGWSADEIRAFETSDARLVTLPGPTWRADAIGLVAIVLADVAWRGRDGWPV